MEYIDIIFDEKRHGLNHLARKILLYLDYFSFIQAKRSCKIIYEFIKSSNVEEIIFSEKLRSDWSYGSPKILKLPKNQENLLADVVSKKINSMMIFKDDTLFISAVNSVYCCLLNHQEQSNEIIDNENTVNESERLKVFTNPNTNRETNVLTSMQILRDTYLLTGSRNGMLSVFNLRTGELESFKQLFGIISEIRCLDDLIATSHLGKQFDMGCITIRRFKSPEEMEVVWSVYEDVMPVFSMDFNYKYIVGLEWIETLDQAQIGVLSVFKRDETENGKERWNRENLDLNHGFTTCCLFKDEFCALGSAGVQETRVVWDFSVIIVDLSKLTVIQVVKGHKSPIFHIQSSGNRLITKDKAGLVYLWDQNSLSDKNYRDEDVNSVALIRRLSEDNEQVECMTADLRKLVFILKEGINCYSLKVQDFWSSQDIQQSI